MSVPYFTPFEPQPSAEERPRVLNSPFDADEPPPLARRAAEAVMAGLASGVVGPGVLTSELYGADGGKMFGVLVVAAPDGTVGWLKSFSGQLARRWDIDGWVPPVFDRAARAVVEPPGEAAVKALTARLIEARTSPEFRDVEARLAALSNRHDEEKAALRARHEANRARRHAERARLAAQGLAAPHPAFHALDQQSRSDDAEARREKARWRAEREAVEAERSRLARRVSALERLRRLVSQEVSWRLYDTYQFENARGRHLSLRALFEPLIPSSGTGDCAAPKLLVHALRQGLVPLALAEFWWGAPPPGGGRVEGAYYPACRDKCGPLLPFLLDGLEVAPSRRYRPPDLRHHELTVVYEDAHLVVLVKPVGLLSVPGTDATVTDSVLERLRARYPAATGPLLVHRLDVETSGLLIAAKDAETFTALQKQFLERTVEKEYVALLDGAVSSPRGVIELPLRVDFEQRPRQVVDFENGKPAVTRFEVLGTDGARTRVAFFPETGRTHQLRVHASHRQGLGTPIVGDRLYGRPERRLMLHAQVLRLTHPATGEAVTFRAPAPF
ncbi:MAG: RluA family pseudouridine synthase [Myxococcota bacterium]